MSSDLVPERLSCFERVLHALEGFRFAAEPDATFAFEIKQVLLADQGSGCHVSSTQCVCQRDCDLDVMLRNELPSCMACSESLSVARMQRFRFGERCAHPWYLSPSDGISMNRQRLLNGRSHACQLASRSRLYRARCKHRHPRPRHQHSFGWPERVRDLGRAGEASTACNTSVQRQEGNATGCALERATKDGMRTTMQRAATRMETIMKAKPPRNDPDALTR